MWMLTIIVTERVMQLSWEAGGSVGEVRAEGGRAESSFSVGGIP